MPLLQLGTGQQPEAAAWPLPALLPPACRSLLSDSQVLVVAEISTTNATQVASYLAGAQQLGTVATMMGLLGGQLDKFTYTPLSAEVRAGCLPAG